MNPPPAPEPRGWRHAAARALDLLYPPDCALCGIALTCGQSLCPDCRADLPRLAAPFCQVCGEMFHGQITGPFACPNCHDLAFAFGFARPATVRDPRTLELIHRLKYRRQIHLAGELGRLARESFADPRLAQALDEAWPLVPVPLHRHRLRHRHFNQAEEIARVLAAVLGMPMLRALRRTRSTETQTRLSRQQRMANLRGAFALTRQGRRWIKDSPPGAVLIDDVLTTGSTVHECAKTLRHAGFCQVWVVTVMRG
ncbi:MAG: double zinc ribbon domain-containing protein [Verrucomicrobiota bacterium]